MAEERRVRLGELLVDAGLLQPADLDRALELQRSEPLPERRRLGKLLMGEGLIDEAQLTQILSHQLSVPWVSLHHIEFSRQLLNLVPAGTADLHGLVPIYVRHVRGQGQTLYLAMEDPLDEDGLSACRGHSGLPVRPMIASPSEIRRAIHVYYGVGARPASRPPVRRASIPVEAPAPPVEAPAPVVVPAPAASPAPIPPTPTEPAPPEPAMESPAALSPAALSPAAASPSEEPPPEIEVAPLMHPALGPPAAVASPAAVVTVAAPEAPPKPRLQLASEPMVVFEDEEPPVSSRPVKIPEPVGGRPQRMVALTLLDGTTIQLPARGNKAAAAAAAAPAAPAPVRRLGEGGTDLTARDLVSALRAVSHGADATEVLGDNVRWEAMFAALLSLLLKKHLIADWEFVEEYKKY